MSRICFKKVAGNSLKSHPGTALKEFCCAVVFCDLLIEICCSHLKEKASLCLDHSLKSWSPSCSSSSMGFSRCLRRPCCLCAKHDSSIERRVGMPGRKRSSTSLTPLIAFFQRCKSALP